MKRLDNELLHMRIRLSFVALRDSDRFLYRCLDRSELQKAKQKIIDSPLTETMTLQHYDQWMADNGLHDCLSNRMHFINEKHARFKLPLV